MKNVSTTLNTINEYAIILKMEQEIFISSRSITSNVNKNKKSTIV
jgi:hypothetical protein